MLDLVSKKLVFAMKANDKKLVTILRDIKSKLTTLEKENPAYTDSDVISILSKMRKQRVQTIEACTDEYNDLKNQELYEISILDEFLPKKMSTDEIVSAVNSIMHNKKISHNIKNLGLIMKIFSEKHKGQDGKIVASVIRELLFT